eukprot:COSAG01_NODE_60620_length_293_cov_4.809278_1_plen_35_part_01
MSTFPRLQKPMKAFPHTPVVNGRASWGAPPCAAQD